MNSDPHSRRDFLQLAGGMALTLRHGLLAAAPAAVAGQAHASLRDGLICLEWDGAMRTRISRVAHGRLSTVSGYRATEYLLREDGAHLAAYRLQAAAQPVPVRDEHGAGSRLVLKGLSPQGIEKIVTATLYERYPGFAVIRASYRNASASVLGLTGWTSCDVHLEAGAAATPAFWSYSGATYEDRRDWVQPLTPGFEQDNYLGMEASDYGGGTPIVDAWHREAGLAVGHIEPRPALVSLPLQRQVHGVRMAVCSRQRRYVAAGATLDTLDAFVAVHCGDHFATLDTYRRVIGERGLKPAPPVAGSYEPIWCAWGYERACTTPLIEGTLAKAKDVGLEWAVIDDGWQRAIGDWRPDPGKYPGGEADLKALVGSIRGAGLKPRLWYSPLAVAPGSDQLHDHADMLLLDKNGMPQTISWWNSFYLCPAYAGTVNYTAGLVRRFIGEWGFAGLKIDGQHLNGVARCYNPAHHHERPEDSVEKLQDFYRAMYEAALQADREAIVEVCPCGTAYSAFNFPYMNQAPASDPESSWQVRLKGKSLKALMGPSAPFAGDHVELSDGHDDFASTVGIGAVVSTKFTWPVDPKPKDSFLLTPEKEVLWRKWIALYRDKMLPQGTYRGELYDIGFDRPETHAIERSGSMYYAFYADRWHGDVALRGLVAGTHRVRDYYNDRDLGRVSGPAPRLQVGFERFLLLEVTPLGPNDASDA